MRIAQVGLMTEADEGLPDLGSKRQRYLCVFQRTCIGRVIRSVMQLQ
jgi:hypothetical protein